MSDPVAAVVGLLDEHLDVPVYGATFQGEPPGVLVRAVGGGALAAGYMPTVDARLDVLTYGESDWQAAEVDRDAARFLHALRYQTTAHGSVHWCRLEGGPTQARDTQTGWPTVLSSWQVYGDWLG